MKRSVSIIIPNFNGRRLLEMNLPSVLAAAAAYGGDVETIVVDDASSDDSVQWLEERYAGAVKVVRRESNGGFSKAIASGVEAASGDLLYFLNSDIRVSEDFLDSVAGRFAEEDVFAVASMAYDNDGVKVVGGRSGLHWRWMRLDVDRRAMATPAGVEAGPTLFASGGHSAYRRDVFMKLGGFDEVFSPFYWEDVDLCMKAWKRGWRVLFEPESVVFHDHQSTIGGLYSRDAVQKIRMRNHFVLNWRNLTDWRLIFIHAVAAPLAVALSKVVVSGAAPGAFFAALKKAPDVMKYRRAAKRDREVRGDRELFGLFGKEFYSTPGVCIFDGGAWTDNEREGAIAALRLKGVRAEFCSAKAAGGLKRYVFLLKEYLALSRRFDAIVVFAAMRADARFAMIAGKASGVPVFVEAAAGDANSCVERLAEVVAAGVKDSGK